MQYFSHEIIVIKMKTVMKKTILLEVKKETNEFYKTVAKNAKLNCTHILSYIFSKKRL